jgi:uncharacterized protein (TIGR02147 family)
MALIPNIFEFSDFRKFLAEHVAACVKNNPHFSKAELCRKLGLPHSRSYINDVIDGKKVTTAYAERFVQALGMDAEEAQYFRTMVKLNQTDNVNEHKMYFSQLIALNRTPKRMLDKKAYTFFEDWRHSAVRTMLDVMDFSSDYKKLAGAIIPALTPGQVRKSINLLKSLNLIARNEKGFYKPTDKAVTTQEWEQNELVKQYQAQWLELAKAAVIRRQEHPQRVTTNLISITKEGYEILEEKVGQIRKEVRSLAVKDEHKADRMYLFAMQLIPAGKIQKKESQ